MYLKKIFLTTLALAIVLSISKAKAKSVTFLKESTLKSVNGGTNCAGCTIVVALVEQLSIVYNQTFEKSLDDLCNLLPKNSIFKVTCLQIVDEYGPLIINGLYEKETPDVVCHAIPGFCKTDPGQPECHLFPKPKVSIAHRVTLLKKNKPSLYDKANTPIDSNICDNPIFKRICEYFDNNHNPAIDLDIDGHSTYQSLRGTSWKGKDCNDLDKNIHPGAKPIGDDRVMDSNCNGIYGNVPNSAGQSYEQLFCNNSKQMGVAVLGDSISAHFHIPEEWLDATKISAAAFEHLAFIAENELDWPELSAITGYMNSTWPVVQGSTRSLYLNLYNMNKCNFRDYQNVAVNGASTGSMKNIMKSLRRDPAKDQPLLVVYSLVGNDVCNGRPDTLNHMTKPKEFYENVVNAMEYLDTILPNGSHVLLTGLANGSLLYQSIGNNIYPIGRVKNDVKYSDVYTYLSCLQVSPCNGWMTTNGTLRDLTTNYALMLSGIVKNITQTLKFKNFDMAYSDFPIIPAINKWIENGGKAWELIEPIDGFHMNQIANALIADEYWSILTTKYPNWLGSTNPHNDDIVKMFGNQGGY